MSSRFVRSVFAVASGTALAQVVVVAFSPLITRIYSPEVFGLQGVFLSLISILSPVIALRYPMAIITAKTDDEALKLARLALLVAMAVASLMWAILLIGGQSITTRIGAEELGNLVFLLPLALLSVAFQSVTDFQAARLGAFRLVGIVSVLQAFVTNLARVIGGLWSPVASVLIAVTTAAPAVKSAMLMAGLRKMRQRTPALTWSDAITLLRKHRDFPMYRVPTDVLNAASQAVPVILLSAFFTPGAVGLYVLTRSILNLPTNVLGAAVGNVIYARFGELQREGQRLLPLLVRTTAALFCLAPVFIGLAWFAPIIFAFVFGEEWREAGHYAQWMALWIAFMLVNTPAIRILPVIRRQAYSLIFNILLLIARVAAFAISAWLYKSALASIAWFSITSVALIIGNIILVIMFTYSFDQKRKENPDD